MVKLPDESRLTFSMPRKLLLIGGSLLAIGVVLVIVHVLTSHGGHHKPGEHHASRVWMSIHLALLCAVPMALGGMYFAAFNHVSGAAWSVTVRRIAESHVWFMPLMLLILAAVVIFGINGIFTHWVYADPADTVLKHKSAWLSKGFFTVRNLAFGVVWLILAAVLYWKSVTQDKDGQFKHTRFMARFSALTLVLFALTFSASSWDLSMSLEPHWFSTMWGVYIFAGLALTAFSLIVLWVWYLKGNGYLGESVNENHIHDLGKYMWGHTIFWAYIGVSQFLLIWYAHLPEETTFYRTRMYMFQFASDTAVMKYNAWAWVSLALIIVRFILPFFLIIKRESKRKLGLLAGVAALVLFGQVLDMYWIIYPTLKSGKFVMFSWQELGPLMALAGAYILVMGFALTRSSLVPKQDPRLEECLHWHQ